MQCLVSQAPDAWWSRMSVATRHLSTAVSIPAFERRAITTLADDQCGYDRSRLGDSGVTPFRETRTWLAAQRYLTQRIFLRSRAFARWVGRHRPY